MINQDPRLPDPSKGNYPTQLNYRLNDLLRQIIGEVNKLSGSAWDGFHPVLGTHHIWIDATGDLRIKSSKPTSDLDGSVIGTQT